MASLSLLGDLPNSTASHPLHTGHTIWLMRRQKHPRGGANANKKKDDDASAAAAAAAGTDPSAAAPATTSSSSNNNNDAVEDWAKSLKKVATFHTVEDFWSVYGHMTRPGDMQASTDLHMFREGIKPVWEDAANRRGGKFHVKIRKGVLGSRYWESVLLSVIGEQFGEYSHEICGVVISVRHGEDVLSLWTRSCDNADTLSKIRDLFKRSLKLPSFVSIEFKRHDAHHQIGSEPASATPPAASSFIPAPPAAAAAGGGAPVWRNTRA